MWTKAVIMDGVTYIKRDFAFWFFISLIFFGGFLTGVGLKW